MNTSQPSFTSNKRLCQYSSRSLDVGLLPNLCASPWRSCFQHGHCSCWSHLYPHLVGKLLYLLCMCLNIAYVVNVVSRNMQTVEVAQLQVVLFMFHYLCHYLSCGIYYIKREVNTLWGYINANFAQDVDDRCSTCAYILTLGSSPIS
jgi:hypothetical protein